MGRGVKVQEPDLLEDLQEVEDWADHDLPDCSCSEHDLDLRGCYCSNSGYRWAYTRGIDLHLPSANRST